MTDDWASEMLTDEIVKWVIYWIRQGETDEQIVQRFSTTRIPLTEDQVLEIRETLIRRGG